MSDRGEWARPHYPAVNSAVSPLAAPSARTCRSQARRATVPFVALSRHSEIDEVYEPSPKQGTSNVPIPTFVPGQNARYWAENTRRLARSGTSGSAGSSTGTACRSNTSILISMGETGSLSPSDSLISELQLVSTMVDTEGGREVETRRAGAHPGACRCLPACLPRGVHAVVERHFDQLDQHRSIEHHQDSCRPTRRPVARPNACCGGWCRSHGHPGWQRKSSRQAPA